MTQDEMLNIIFKMSYLEYVETLKTKYGHITEPYFRENKNGVLVKNTNITKGSSDGLYIHHVYECYYVGLSDLTTYTAQLSDVDDKIKFAQDGNNLVYCNLLEHLILHIKIALDFDRGQEEVGINLITDDLNRWYELNDQGLFKQTYSAKNQVWKQKAFDNIKDDYANYVFLAYFCIIILGIDAPIVVCNSWYGTVYEKLVSDIDTLHNI